jgi:hypothetical protein
MEGGLVDGKSERFVDVKLMMMMKVIFSQQANSIIWAGLCSRHTRFYVK